MGGDVDYVYGGGDDDTITVAKDGRADDVLGDFSDSSDTDGADKIDIEGFVADDVYGGGGDDTITVAKDGTADDVYGDFDESSDTDGADKIDIEGGGVWCRRRRRQRHHHRGEEWDSRPCLRRLQEQ